MKSFLICLLSVISLVVSLNTFASPHIENSSPLFSSSKPLPIKLEAPLKELFAKLDSLELESKKLLKINGFLTYGNSVIPVEIRVRGFSSLHTCNFPKLALKLDKNAIKGTIFQDNENIDLSTHCSDDPKLAKRLNMNFPKREVLNYKWQGLAKMIGYSARASVITYVESATGETYSHQGFLLEHMSSLLRRTNTVEIRRAGSMKENEDMKASKRRKFTFKSGDSKRFSTLDMDRFEIFQSLIGNFDYSPWSLHNVKALELTDGTLVPMAMDFNLTEVASGRRELVFSLPSNAFEDAEKVKITANVRKILNEYLEKKAEFYSAIDDLGAEDPVGIKNAKSILDDFFQYIEKIQINN